MGALAALAVDDVPAALSRWTNLADKSVTDIRELWNVRIKNVDS